MEFELTPNAISYCFQEIARRLGIAHAEGCYLNGVKICYDSEHNELMPREIRIAKAAPNQCQLLLALPRNSIEWIETRRLLPPGNAEFVCEKLPILFPSLDFSPSQPVTVSDGGKIEFKFDLLATIFFCLSRYEEFISTTEDPHSRFPCSESVATKQSFLCEPIVDQYVLLLGKWLEFLSIELNPPPFRVHLSHDIDHPLAYRTIKLFGRRVASGLIRQKSIRKAIAPFLHITNGYDPFYEATNQLARISTDHGLQSCFYFMAARPSSRDEGYPIEDQRIRGQIVDLSEMGHEIGFHPSYLTHHSPDVFSKELARLNSACPNSVTGGRHHYLRFNAGSTWRMWEQAGLQYDATLGYAEEVGFRASTCHPFRPYDLASDRQLNLLEIPLTVMDGTLFGYKSLSVSQAEQIVATLIEKCRAVRGIFSLLWHNTYLIDQVATCADFYRQTIDHLAGLKPANFR